MTTTHRNRGVVDFADVLKGIPAGTRQKLYETILKGKKGQHDAPDLPGLEEQFVNSLVEYQAFTSLVDQRRELISEMSGDPEYTEKQIEAAKADLSAMLYSLHVKQENLNAIGTELKRIQATLDEIAAAGTHTATE